MSPLLEYLHELDTHLLLALNGLHADMLDQVMYTLTNRFVWIPFYAFLAVLVVKRLGWRNAILSFLLVALTITLADQICGSLIRPMAMRMRPSNLNNDISPYIHIVNNYRGGRYGMASCHAANCFALALFLIRTMRWQQIGALLILGWATIVVYTRIYLGVHYPGDIIVGGAIGSAIALLTSECYLRLAHRDAHWERFLHAIPSLSLFHIRLR